MYKEFYIIIILLVNLLIMEDLDGIIKDLESFIYDKLSMYPYKCSKNYIFKSMYY